jgi:hypothetical protein
LFPFFRLPLLERGTPIAREILPLAEEMPVNLLKENPLGVMVLFPYQYSQISSDVPQAVPPKRTIPPAAFSKPP